MRIIDQQIKNYLDYCEYVQGLLPMSIYEKKRIYVRFFSYIGIDDLNKLTNDHYNAWVRHLAETGACNRTINNYTKSIKAIIKWSRDSGLPIPEFKMYLVQRRREDPPKRVWYTREQIDRALAFADRREWLMIAICYECGLRITELRMLKLSDIRDSQIRFIGKYRKQGVVYISDCIKQRLDDYVQANHINNWLWPGRFERQPLSSTHIHRAMRRPFLAAGFADFHPHALRHSCATEVVSSGASMEVAQQILRHSNVRTTQIYVHSFDGGNRELFEKYRHSLTNADSNLR